MTQDYLIRAQEFLSQRGDSAAGGQHGESCTPLQAAEAAAGAAGASCERSAPCLDCAKSEKCEKRSERGTDAEALLAMLDEMRPYLSRALRGISDEGLLGLAKWNLHVAAERAIDARLARRR